MAFEIKMTEEQIIDGLKTTYGTEFTAADVRGFCAANDITYQTVTKKLKKYRVKPGKWNLQVTVEEVEKIEKAYASPSVESVAEKNLVPETDDTFVKFYSILF